MSGGGGESKTTTQNYSPEEAARRAKVMSEAEKVYKQTKGQVGAYPGAEVAPFSQATQQGQQSMMNAGAMANQDAGALQQGLNYGLTGAMDVQNNPYLQQAMQAAITPVQQQFQDPGGIMSQIRTGVIQGGGTGGSRQGIAEGIAAGRYAQELGNITSRMGSDAYNQGQDTFARTMALAPQTMQAYGTGGQMQSAVGAQQENMQQALNEYDSQSQMWDINAPWMPLENYANIVFGAGGSESTTTASGPARNPLMGAAGGAMAGMSIAGPWGAAGGAILGALM